MFKFARMIKEKTEIIPDDVAEYLHFVRLNEGYWETKEYEIINLNKLIRWKKEIQNSYYEQLIDKIVQNHFKNIYSIVDVFRDYKYDVNLSRKITKQDVYSHVEKLPEVLEIKVGNDVVEIMSYDFLMAIQNADINDLLRGDLVVIPRIYYANLKLMESSLIPRKKHRKEFLAVKFSIGFVFVFIMVILILLAIFSQQFESWMGEIKNWIGSWTGSQVNAKYSNLLIGFIIFLIKIFVIYLVYRIMLLLIVSSFNSMKRITIKKESNRLSSKKRTFKERVADYQVFVIGINKKSESAVKTLNIFLRLVLFAFVIIIILSLFKIPFTSLLTAAGIFTTALSFGSKALLSDYFAGVMYAFEDHYNLGDLVKINGVQGRIIGVNIRRICIETSTKEHCFILHSQINDLTNFSKGTNRAVVNFDIAYESDPQKVVDILQRRLNKIWRTNKNIVEPPKVKGLTEFHDSGIGIMVTADCDRETRWSVERWLRLKIFYICVENNIEIPYRKIQIATDGINNKFRIYQKAKFSEDAPNQES